MVLAWTLGGRLIMKIALRLVTATAIGLAMGGVAQAGDSNTLYLKQIGGDNSASIQQSNGSGNHIGTSADPVTQKGKRNDFRFSNAGYGGGSNDVIRHAKQTGDDNYFSNSVWNDADNNVIKDFEQKGKENRARIDMNGSDNGLVDTVRQTGNANHLVIEQAGSSSSGNQILSVNMIGNNNGLGPDGNGDWQRAGTYLYQSGNNNLIRESTIVGDGNIGPAGNSSTYRNTHRIEQRGNDNGKWQARAVTYGSGNGIDYNRIWIFQNGDRNDFDVVQGLTSDSTGNHATITQTGDDNRASGSQYGDYNTLEVTQIGDFNGAFGTQYGDHNTVEVTQTGDLNWAPGYQNGDYNTVQVTQTGSGNWDYSDQLGDHNTVEATQIGYNNNRYSYQAGDNNTLRASFTGDHNGGVAMTGGAGDLVDSAHSRFGYSASGRIIQNGLWNSATLTVTSSNNQFALGQFGDHNVINGTIGGGDGNQVAVLQQGNHNIANFTQWGSGNNIAISQ